MNLRLTYTKPQIEIFFPAKPERHTIIPKGRRFGATRGAAHACIEWAVEGNAVLWGDTIHGNIARYWDRYFEPPLHSLDGLNWSFDKVAKVARIGSGYIDFRSADNPQNWEGFGYNKIILNEAGLILKDPYLYTNAVRPMMIDPGNKSELYALGVPKGKKLKDGNDHPFYKMWQRVGEDGYRGKTYSSYDNPLLSEDDIAELEKDIGAMDPDQIRQEIYGEFIDRIAGNPFAFAWDRKKHVRKCVLDQRLPVIVGIDFNVDPFCALICQQQGPAFVVTHEIAIKSGTIEELCERIRAVAPNVFQHNYTGDRTGAARRIQIKSNASMWDDFLAVMHVRESQLRLPNNPTHKESREQVNYCLHHHPAFYVDENCKGLIYDMESVEVDVDLSIIKQDRSKAAQQADKIDIIRYIVNTYLRPWIDTHRKTNALRPNSKGERHSELHR